jgi:large subunit ribosomal protein L21
VIDAVIRTGGKQYRVHEGSLVNVATLEASPGDRLELRDVLLISDGDNVTVGSPTVAGAVVLAEVVEHGKAKKVFNFKYKAKVRYRRKRGHRQGFTRLAVKEIRIGDAPARPSAATAEVAPAEDAGEVAAPARRRRRTAGTEE